MEQEISRQIKTLEVMVVNYGLDLVGAIAILVIGWIVAGWIRVAVSKGLSRLPHPLPEARYSSDRWGGAGRRLRTGRSSVLTLRRP